MSLPLSPEQRDWLRQCEPYRDRCGGCVADDKGQPDCPGHWFRQIEDDQDQLNRLLAERDALAAEVERLRKDVEQLRAHVHMDDATTRAAEAKGRREAFEEVKVIVERRLAAWKGAGLDGYSWAVSRVADDLAALAEKADAKQKY